MIRPHIRPATDNDGEYIQDILLQVGQIPHGCDFSQVSPSWLVAEYDETIVGAIQVLAGKPFGHIGFWAVMPGYTHSGIGIYLLRAAESVLRLHGINAYTGMTCNEDVKKHLEKDRGMIFGDPCSVIFKRI